MEQFQQRVRDIDLSSCQIHQGNQLNMICVDKDCIETPEQFLNFMCVKCIEENVHQKLNHLQKPIKSVLIEFLAAIQKKQQITDKSNDKFTELVSFIEDLRATVIETKLKVRIEEVFSILQLPSKDETFLKRLIEAIRDIECDEQQEVQLRPQINTSIDSDQDSSVAEELFKDFEKLLEIYEANHKQFDNNIAMQLQGYKLLTQLKDSPLGSAEKERLYKEAFRLDSTANDGKRSSGSRRQSLEMFEADKKILLLVNENDRLNFSLSAKIEEMDSVKMKLQQAEEDLKRRRSSNTTGEDDPQIRILRFELERLNKALEFKDKEIENLYHKSSSKIAENGDIIIELQAQIDMLVQENGRLNAVISAKDDEIGSIQSLSNLEDKTAEGLKTEIVRLNQLLAEQYQNMELIERDRRLAIEIKNEEIRQLKDNVLEMSNNKQQQINENNEQNNQKFESLSLQIRELQEELHNQAQEIELKKNEIEIWKGKIASEPNCRDKQISLVSQHSSYTPSNPANNKLIQSYAINNSQSPSYLCEKLESANDKSKNFNHLKMISAIEKFDIYKKIESNSQPQSQVQQKLQQSSQLQQQLSQQIQQHQQQQQQQQLSLSQQSSFSCRFKSPSSANSTSSKQTKNIIQPLQEYRESFNKTQTTQNLKINQGYSFVPSTKKPQIQGTSLQDLPNSFSHSANSQKNLKQIGSILSSPTPKLLETKVQSLQKEIGRLNSILGLRDPVDKKQTSLLKAPSFQRTATYRSGSEGIKQSNSEH